MTIVKARPRRLPAQKGSSLTNRLKQHVPDLCLTLLSNGKLQGDDWVIGSLDGEPGESLKVCLIGSKAGVWHDFSTGDKGNTLSLIAAVLRVSKPEAREWFRRWLKSAPPSPITPPSAKACIDNTTNQKLALKIWREAVPIDPQSPTAKYLTSRGIKKSKPDNLRHHASLHHKSNKSFPALIAAVQNVDGEITAIHRTYLSKNGRSKASIKPNRMMLAKCSGGAVRLTLAETKVAICEGIETGLSVMEACPDLPVWASLSTSGMVNIKLPSSITEVIILADGDDAGEKAAVKLSARLHVEGKTVRIARPGQGLDFNDLLGR